MKALLLILITLQSSLALAGRETGNGGDPVALEFHAAALEAIAVVERNQEKFPELRKYKLYAVLEEAEILVVEHPLRVVRGEYVQESAAFNSKDPARISIYRKGWGEISDPKIRRGLALHEVLGLVGLEETGIYRLVSRFLRIGMEGGASAPPAIEEGASIGIYQPGVSLVDYEPTFEVWLEGRRLSANELKNFPQYASFFSTLGRVNRVVLTNANALELFASDSLLLAFDVRSMPLSLLYAHEAFAGNAANGRALFTRESTRHSSGDANFSLAWDDCQTACRKMEVRAYLRERREYSREWDLEQEQGKVEEKKQD